MGSGISKYNEQLEEEQWNEDLAWLEGLAEKIKTIQPNTEEFRNLKWMITNEKRILATKKIIELISI